MSLLKEEIEMFNNSYKPMVTKICRLINKNEKGLSENQLKDYKRYMLLLFRGLLTSDIDISEAGFSMITSLLDLITSDSEVLKDILHDFEKSIPFIRYMQKLFKSIPDEAKQELIDFYNSILVNDKPLKNQSKEKYFYGEPETEGYANMEFEHCTSDEIESHIKDLEKSGDQFGAALAFVWHFSSKGKSIKSQMPSEKEFLEAIKSRVDSPDSIFNKHDIVPHAIILMVGPDDWQPNKEFMEDVSQKVKTLIQENDSELVMAAIFFDGTLVSITDVLRDEDTESDNPYLEKNVKGSYDYTKENKKDEEKEIEPKEDSLSHLLDAMEKRCVEFDGSDTKEEQEATDDTVESSPVSLAEEVLNEFKENKIGAEFISDPNEKGEIYLFPTIQCILTDKKSVVAVRADSKEDALEKYKGFRKSHKFIPEDSDSNYQVSTMFGIYSSEDNFKDTLTKEPMLYYSEKTNTVGEVKNINDNIEDYTDFYAKEE